MKRICGTFIPNQKYATDAYVYSLELPTEEQIEVLLKGQEIVEAKWLSKCPMVLFPVAEPLDDSMLLFGPIRLLYEKNWDAIDNATMFLVNNAMRIIGAQEEPPFISMEKVASSAGLRKLFEDEMFVVATCQFPYTPGEGTFDELDFGGAGRVDNGAPYGSTAGRDDDDSKGAGRVAEN